MYYISGIRNNFHMVLKKEHMIFGVLFLVILVSAYTISLTIKHPEECKTNEDCEPKELSAEDTDKLFICDQGKCRTEAIEGPKRITCQTNDDCPNESECIDGMCWGPE
jgi:hypothetical protein